MVSARRERHRHYGFDVCAFVFDDSDGSGLSHKERIYSVFDVAAYQLYRQEQDPDGRADDHLLHAQALHVPSAAQHLRDHTEHQRRCERRVHRDLRHVCAGFRRADRHFADGLFVRGRFNNDRRFAHRAGDLLCNLFPHRAQENPQHRSGKQKSNREDVQSDPAGDGRHQRSQDHGQRKVLCRRLSALRNGVR